MQLYTHFAQHFLVILLLNAQSNRWIKLVSYGRTIKISCTKKWFSRKLKKEGTYVHCHDWSVVSNNDSTMWFIFFFRWKGVTPQSFPPLFTSRSFSSCCLPQPFYLQSTPFVVSYYPSAEIVFTIHYPSLHLPLLWVVLQLKSK